MAKVYKIMHKTITPAGNTTEFVYDMFADRESAKARLEKIAKAENKNGVMLTARSEDFIQTKTVCISQYKIVETEEN